LSTTRVRFAPAPTGFLHVGGARTALFNWLYARHTGGTLVLRIEDTDLERSREEWVTGIQDTLRWLGLDWDEGPYRQSERLGEYTAAGQRLLDSGHAYYCYCTADELDARAEAAKASGRDPGYDGRCRDLTGAQRSAFEAEGRPRSIRFRTPDEGVSRFEDVIRGEVTVEWATVTDFVIVRSTGAAVFFLANAVDDGDMGITHVIRGEDLTDSTHRVLALRDALGYEGRPTFAHLPLIVGADRGKLSKRHGAVALEDFAAQGYLPEALRNYLALLGFSAAEDGSSEVLDIDELVAAFDLTKVNRSAAFFDYEKLNWMNGEYIRRLPVGEFVERLRPLARVRYGDAVDRGDTLAGAAAIGQVRATTLVGAVESMWFLFVDDADFAIRPDSLDALRVTERAGEILDAVAAHLEQCEWTPEGVDLRPVLDGLGVKPRKGLPAVYAAVEGTHAGLPLFDSIVLLGRERALARVQAARAQVANHSN
jgi:glutamyl-tRNA synthetase